MKTGLSVIIISTLLALSAAAQPNILFCISDDQSYAHTGANGDPVIQTPAFDRVAKEGIRFTHAFCDAPTCGPSRSAILTGQPIWRLEEAGNIHSTLPAKFATYTEELQKAGYVIGHTGKGWSPGRLEVGGRSENPAGPAYKKFHYGRGDLAKERPLGVASTAYSHNFGDFLKQRPKDKPFCFWLGTREPHRGYRPGLWKAKKRDPSKVVVPPIFPDTQLVREDILDYFHEIEHFDNHVGDAIAHLEKIGELDNTIIVVTSDHGMPFPRAKASLYDMGARVPLAIRWPKGIKSSGRVYEGFVNLSDLAPTFLEAAGLKVPAMMTARSLMDVFASPSAVIRPAAFVAMERHDGCRKGGKGYPSRAIRTADFLYIKNVEPDRWPSGDPDRRVCARNIPFGEVDSSPTKTLMMQNKDKDGFKRLYDLAFAKRPAEELYDMKKDPGQLVNVAAHADYADARKRLSVALERHLVATKDPRSLGIDAPWDYYPYYGVRKNRDWTVDPRPGEARAPVPKAKMSIKKGGVFDLRPSLDKFAAGWTASNCGAYRDVGLRAELKGRKNVLVTHPLNKTTACTISRKVTIPKARPRLRLVVGYYRQGDWQLVVKADGKELLSKVVGPNTAKDGWLEQEVDLSAFAGKTVSLDLLNQSNNWAYEQGLWAEIKVLGE